MGSMRWSSLKILMRRDGTEKFRERVRNKLDSNDRYLGRVHCTNGDLKMYNIYIQYNIIYTSSMIYDVIDHCFVRMKVHLAARVNLIPGSLREAHGQINHQGIWPPNNQMDGLF